VGREPGLDQVAVLGREHGRVTEQGRPAAIPPDQPPVGREHRDRRLAQPGEHALHSGRDVIVDGSVVRRLQAGQAVQVIAFLAGQPQRAGQGADHLRGRGGGPALLQADDVVHRDPGELGQFLPAQAGGAARATRREPDVRGRQPVPPGADRRALARFVRTHPAIMRA
jgi:hypothetical protein